MIKRIEIDKEYADVIAELVLGDNFDWYWNNATLYSKSDGSFVDDKTKDTPQFTHNIYDGINNNKSNYYHFFSEMIKHIEPHIGKIKRVVRIKANLITKDTTYPYGFYNGPHADFAGDNLVTFLYYVNDSDGDTVLFNEYLDGKPHNIQKIHEIDRETPKAGMGIIFDSQRLHTSTPPKITDRRVVINYVLETEC